MSRFNLVSGITLLAAVVIGCSSDKSDRATLPGGPSSNAVPADPTTPSPAPMPTSLKSLNKAVDELTPVVYETDLKPYFTEYCVSCHGGFELGGGIDLSSFASVKTNISQSLKSIAGHTMPKDYDTLSSDQKEELEHFEKLGALWNEAGRDENLAALTTVKWEQTIKPLNDQVCALCHTGESAEKGILLATREDWITNWDAAIKELSLHKMPEKMDDARIDRVLLLMKEWKTRGRK